MEIDIITLFPTMFSQPLSESIIGRAVGKELVSFHLHSLRDFSDDARGTVDDAPYGGGAGMVLKYDVLFRAWEFAQARRPEKRATTLLMSPKGRPLDQAHVENLREPRYIIVCGHYEGVDERFIEDCVDEELSLGDFILSGGELAAMVVVDAIVRLLPGALGNKDSLAQESFSNGLLEYPHYTRPSTFRNRSVPEVLLSGDHARIEHWRKEESQKQSLAKRPDLIQRQENHE